MNKKLCALAIASSLLSVTSHAEINFSGFATVAAGITTSSDETLYGYDDSFNFNEGSLFALQATSDLGEKLGATVQILARGSNDWDPKFNWAYLSYDATDDLRFLAGRQRIPFYMYSDYLDVSYAFPWIAGPKSVYESLTDTFDGLGAIYNTSMGDVDANFHAIYGRTITDVDAFGYVTESDTSNLMGLASTFTYDWLTFRAAYFMGDIDFPLVPFESLATGWEAYGYQEIADYTRIEDDDATFLEFGVQINLDQVVFIAEYTNLEREYVPIGDEESYFVMAGYQFDSVLLHVTYGANEDEATMYTANVPFGIADGLDTLKATTDSILNGQKTDDSFVTIGVRYDFHESAALKIEYTEFSDDNNSSNDAGLLSTALVTVF